MDLKWAEIPSKVNFGSHFVKKNHKNKNCGIDLKW